MSGVHKYPTISFRISPRERDEIEAKIKASGMQKKVPTAATVRTYEKSDNLCYQDIYKISITEVLRRNNRIFEWRTLWKNRKLN